MATSISLGRMARTALNSRPEPLVPNPFKAGGIAKQPHQHGRELFFNHLWESLNSGAKILFFAIVTPIMLAAWGNEQFGLFAVANSCVALMAFLDLGLRTLTRLGLTNSRLSQRAKIRLHVINVAAFSVAAGACIGTIGLLAANGCWHRWLHLPPSADGAITVTASLTALLMAVQLLVERIAAAGHLSRIKVALVAGNLLAFAIVVALLKQGANVATVTIAYFAALTLPLLFLLPFSNLRPRLFIHTLRQIRRREIVAALHSGGWINVITASWIFQCYGLVLLISLMLGPAAAGVFFLYLKLSELLSVLGASSSEPTIAALAGAIKPQDRHRHFAASYKTAIALCLAGAVGYTFFSGDLFRIWLHQPLPSPYTGFVIGLFGVTSGFTRMVTAASLGLAKPRSVALGLLSGAALVTASITIFREAVGPEQILIINCAAVLFILPSAIQVARDLGSTFVRTWAQPLMKFGPYLLGIIAICWMSAQLNGIAAIVVAVLLSALLCARYVFRGPAGQSARVKDSVLGYDTRSLRSALIMRGVDLINPLRRGENFRWAGPCVISSTAGLGDLFIHLPLIAGIAKEARRRGLSTSVALRPAHVAIGRACGWDVVPFDPALEDFFKNPFAIRPMNIVRQIRETRRLKPNLWIDLAGNAVSALSIKAAGAKRIAARVTRGGRSLVNHPLPHTLNENEYANVERVAEALGSEPDFRIFDCLRGKPITGTEDAVVLCLTTICRWRNWPLQNFLTLIERFPEVQFVATGFSAEVASEEQHTLREILKCSNVVSRIDKVSILELIRWIAHSRAVVTNDTSTAHIANAFRKPGVVLFGPASPDKLAAPYGLKSFVDRTCPFHPCVQWTCRNEENWCMQKINVEAVVEHLARVLEVERSYAAAANVG